MTTTRQQLEDVIDRQLFVHHCSHSTDSDAPVDASRRAILAAVDDWAASQAAAAVTPPATIDGPKVAARIRARLGSRRQQMTRYWVLVSDHLWDNEPQWPAGFRPVEPGGRENACTRWWLFEDDDAPPELEGKSVEVTFAEQQDADGNRWPVISERRVRS